MSNSLASRVKRIIAGSAHALVGAVEQAAPEAVMEQSIRELEQVLADVRLALGRELANKHLATKRLSEENRKHEELKQQLTFALEQKRSDLAEAAISKQLDIEAQIPLLDASILDSGETQKELETFIAALEARRREMQDELRSYRETHSSTGQGVHAGTNVGRDAAKVDGRLVLEAKSGQASDAFSRTMERATGIRTAEKASASNTEEKLRELEKLARENRIKERLAAAKALVES